MAWAAGKLFWATFSSNDRTGNHDVRVDAVHDLPFILLMVRGSRAIRRFALSAVTNFRV
jgi:hypothetical protein